MKSETDKETCDLQALLNPQSKDDIENVLNQLRNYILHHGLPESLGNEKDREEGVRSRVWKILLRIPHLDAEEYIMLVRKKKSISGDNIKNDTFRTIAKDDKFKKGVDESRLI
ncbi:MAG: hypothetical protein EZS28_021893 [Streblomastix strix]|uniref:Rab-GAP TBC domain-containing protein n=1 Tax=Streblomastix strix TaxID=222440 RepID=A0A5J4VJ14_9EUKA|nr:MAG: hypothetical protein EZS28_021893 [Streblomastix strix]